MPWLTAALTTLLEDNLKDVCPLSVAQLGSTYSSIALLLVAMTAAIEQQLPCDQIAAIVALAQGEDQRSEMLMGLGDLAHPDECLQVMRAMKMAGIRFSLKQAKAMVKRQPNLLVATVSSIYLAAG